MSKFCASPWMSLFVYNDGIVKSCCAGRFDWGDLKKQSLNEIVNNPKVLKLKEDLLAGRDNEYCKYCDECESTSGHSQRDYFQQFELADNLLNDPNNFDLQMTDIRWNNLCQLNCVYCDTLWSTTWSKLKKQEFQPIINDYHNDVLIAVNKNKDKMKAIIMGGGEPLLHKQNVELLRSLPNDIKIDIMTNFSMKLESTKVFEELSKKSNVNWCISFENTGDCFEFVRHGASWDQINQNLKQIMEFKGHEITIKATYNLLCGTKLVDLYRFANSINQQIHWQPLIHPSELYINNFSKKVIQKFIDSIDELFDSEELKVYESRRPYGSRDFLQVIKNGLSQRLTEDYTPINNNFIDWIKNYHKQYTTNVKTFGELWPEIPLGE